MKKILTLILVSALGGIITLGSYKLFLEEEKPILVATETANPIFLPTSNIDTLINTEKAPDFTVAAENTVNAVVHVKNLAQNSRQMTFEDLFFGRRSQSPQIGTGSGVIINTDGYIITNNQVITDAEQI